MITPKVRFGPGALRSEAWGTETGPQGPVPWAAEARAAPSSAFGVVSTAELPWEEGAAIGVG